MIGSSKNSTENYPRKCFWTQDKETRVNFNPGLSANQPLNNSAQINLYQADSVIDFRNTYPLDSDLPGG